jgi:hypothetical protein
MMQYPVLAAFSPFVVVFVIESLFKYDAISSPGCLASSCGRFFLNSFSNMMQYPLLDALPALVVLTY